MKKICILFLCIGILSGCSEQFENEQKEEKVVAAKSFLKEDTCFQYHYEQLNKKNKKMYEAIFKGLSDYEENIELAMADTDTVYEIIEFVLYDHPEIYDYASSKLYTYEDSCKLEVEYIDRGKRKDKIQRGLQRTLQEVKAQIPVDASDYDKVRIVYEYMIARCEYVESAKDNQNIVSSLVDHQSVCAGYAKGLQYLLNKMGIDCAYISGEIIAPEEGENSNHAWNMIKMNDDYYYFDATWGDIDEVAVHPCHAYFMMSQEEMLKLYTPRGKTEATTVYDNYFLHNGVYLTSYNEDVIGQIMVNSVTQGTNVMEIKCSPDVFNEVEYQLATNGRIYNIVDANGYYFSSLSYITSPELNIIEIILK